MPKVQVPQELLAKDKKNQLNEFKIKNNICTFEQFFEAVATGNVQKVQKLNYLNSYLNNKTDSDTSALFVAVANDYVGMVKYLLDEGADTGIKTELCIGFTPLHMAVRDRKIAIIKLLLEKGSNIEAEENRGWTPLHLAVFGGDSQVEVATLLIDKGANLSAKTKNKTLLGYDGCTPLHVAAEYGFHGQTRMIKLLLSKKANLEARNDIGCTPLHWAATYGSTEVAKVLLDNGADLESEVEKGVTPLYLAAQNNRSELVLLLLERGANIATQAANGTTPLSMAYKEGHVEVVKILKENAMTVNNFLYVKQGGIARWQYSNTIRKTNEYGLFTDNFFNCIIIILREKTNRRLVMIHADCSITLGDIKQEIEWCGKNCEKYIYYKEHAAAEETIDDIFAGDLLLNEFSLNLVLMTRKNGKIVEDKDLPAFRDGTRVPEFEITTIFTSLDENVTLYRAYKGKIDIKDDIKIQQVYQQLQQKEWATFLNKRGSNPKAVDSIGTKFSAKELFTSKYHKPVTHKRIWASLSLRQQLYPSLDSLSKYMESLNLKLGMIDPKFADKSSKTGWQLFELEGTQSILAIINLKNEATIVKFCDIISESSKLTTHCYKSGETYCLGIKLLRHCDFVNEIIFIRDSIHQAMSINPAKFKQTLLSTKESKQPSKSDTPEVKPDKKDPANFLGLSKGFLR